MSLVARWTQAWRLQGLREIFVGPPWLLNVDPAGHAKTAVHEMRAAALEGACLVRNQQDIDRLAARQIDLTIMDFALIRRCDHAGGEKFPRHEIMPTLRDIDKVDPIGRAEP